MNRNKKLKSNIPHYSFFPKNRKGISVMIGYVLLISTAVILSIIVYQWLRTYVPSESLECPSETSLFIKSVSCISEELNLTLKNNGNFNLAGYFIRASTQEDQDFAATDLSLNLQSGSSSIIYQDNSVLFSSEIQNSFNPNEESTNVFDVSGIPEIYFIEIIPIRFQTEDNKINLVNCGNQKVREDITCT